MGSGSQTGSDIIQSSPPPVERMTDTTINITLVGLCPEGGLCPGGSLVGEGSLSGTWDQRQRSPEGKWDQRQRHPQKEHEIRQPGRK